MLYCRIQDVGGAVLGGRVGSSSSWATTSATRAPSGWAASVVAAKSSTFSLPASTSWPITRSNRDQPCSTLPSLARRLHPRPHPGQYFRQLQFIGDQCQRNTSGGAFLPRRQHRDQRKRHRSDVHPRRPPKARAGSPCPRTTRLSATTRFTFAATPIPCHGHSSLRNRRNIVVHDNVIRGCASACGEKKDGAHWRGDRRADLQVGCANGAIPRRGAAPTSIAAAGWLAARRPYAPGPEIEAFDPDKGVFRLAGTLDLSPRWSSPSIHRRGSTGVHHNVINNCDRLVEFDVFGGPTAVFSDNPARGEVKQVKIAVSIRGGVGVTQPICGL